MKRILIACEESQEVCKAFRAMGQQAYSCDLQKCSGGHPEWHIQDDVLNVIGRGWDMMIAHPPCTYLSNAGIGYFNIERYGEKAIKRMTDRLDAAKLFMQLYSAPIEYICIENPVGFINSFLKPKQIIHPYYFGNADNKQTCLWLRNLPPLLHTKADNLFENSTHVKVVPTYIDKSGKPRYFTDAISGGREGTQRARSKTFPGIAKAMAKQWTTL